MKLAAALLLVASVAHADPPGLTDPHELAEARYQHLRLRVDPGFELHRGLDPDPIGSQDFYREVGRPDLAEKHHARRVLANTSLVAGIVLYGLTTYEVIEYVDRAPDFSVCDDQLGAQYDACWNGAEAKAHADADAHAWPLIGSAVGMVAAFTIATWMYVDAEPVPEREARDLADQHDRDLRYRLGLVPYIGGDGGGVTINGAW